MHFLFSASPTPLYSLSPPYHWWCSVPSHLLTQLENLFVPADADPVITSKGGTFGFVLFLPPPLPSSVAFSQITDSPCLSWFHATTALEPLPSTSNNMFLLIAKKNNHQLASSKTFSPHISIRVEYDIITPHIPRMCTQFTHFLQKTHSHKRT